MAFQRSKHIVLQDTGFDDDVLVYDVDKGILHVVNSTAGYILNVLENGRTLDELCEAVVAEYEIAPLQAKRELTGILALFFEKGLIEEPPALETAMIEG